MPDANAAGAVASRCCWAVPAEMTAQISLEVAEMTAMLAAVKKKSETQATAAKATLDSGASRVMDVGMARALGPRHLQERDKVLEILQAVCVEAEERSRHWGDLTSGWLGVQSVAQSVATTADSSSTETTGAKGRSRETDMCTYSYQDRLGRNVFLSDFCCRMLVEDARERGEAPVQTLDLDAAVVPATEGGVPMATVALKSEQGELETVDRGRRRKPPAPQYAKAGIANPMAWLPLAAVACRMEVELEPILSEAVKSRFRGQLRSRRQRRKREQDHRASKREARLQEARSIEARARARAVAQAEARAEEAAAIAAAKVAPGAEMLFSSRVNSLNDCFFPTLGADSQSNSTTSRTGVASRNGRAAVTSGKQQAPPVPPPRHSAWGASSSPPSLSSSAKSDVIMSGAPASSTSTSAARNKKKKKKKKKILLMSSASGGRRR